MTTAKSPKTITFFRSATFLNESQVGMQQYMAKSKQAIGGYWASTSSKAQGTGLTPSEIKMLLPEVLEIHPDDREFRQKVKEFYESMDTQVPYGVGRTLNISLEDDEKELSEKNLPVEVMDYLRYRHAIKHPEVAMSKADAIGNQLIKFYVHNPEEVKETSKELREKRRDAMTLYIQVSTDEEKMTNVMALFGEDPRAYTYAEKSDFLEAKVQSKVLADVTKFIDIVNDKQLETKAFINKLVKTGVLKNVGTRFAVTQTNAILADDMDAMIIEMQDEETNSELIVSLKAQLQEAMAKKVKKAINLKK